MKSKKSPAPQRAGTAKRIPVEEALRRIGDDPATLLLAVQMMDRVLARRRRRR